MIADSVGFDYHGSAVTHLDALSHASYDGVGYGGRPLDQGWPATGADVAQAASGVVGRGVLLDIPRLLGVPRLEPGHAVTPGQIEEAERRQGVRLGRGDIMLLRTGHPARPPSAAPASPGRPGLHPESLRLVQERQVAVIGCDTPNDAKPCVVEPAALMPHPVHTIGLVSMGLWLLDNCALEELADACAALRRYQFFFVIGNLRLRGVTGSPVNPLAVF
jgi:kynurenine formamidase